MAIKIHYSKYPDCPVTQGILQQENIGAVVAAFSARIFGKDPDNAKPDFRYTDRMIQNALGRKIPIHLHPVLARFDRDGLNPADLFLGHFEVAKTIVNRYAYVTDRITLVNELILSPQDIWQKVVEFYSWANQRHPHLQLWISDYGISKMQDRVAILARLRDLKKEAPALAGFIGQDYVDLSSVDDPVARYFKANALGTLPLIKFRYLIDFIGQVNELELKFALEHSTFSDFPDLWVQQKSIYQCLSRICERTESEFWLWNICDRSAKFWAPDRKVYPGLWDEDGNEKAGVLAG